MSTVALKLDGRTCRGHAWKELSKSGKALNQGVLHSNKMCSNCNATPDVEKECIKCMKCNHVFHAKCLLKPLVENELKTIAQNPSLWWFCSGCICLKSGDANNHDNTELGATADVILQNTLMVFKKDMLQLVSETIEKKLHNHKAIPATTSSNSNTVHENASRNADLSVSVSPASPPVAWGAIPTLDQMAHPKEIPPHKQTLKCVEHPPRKNAALKNHVIILEPNDSEYVNNVTSKKDAMRHVNEAMDDVNVNFCKIKKSGIVALGFSDAESKSQAELKLNEHSGVSEIFVTRSPKKILPKVTIHGINDVLFDGYNSDDKEKLKSVLRKDILKRNPTIKNLLSNVDECMEVVMLQKVMPTKSEVTYTAALKMSVNIRKLIKANNDKIYISLSRCKVYDRFYVMQCYHCQKLGHTSSTCADKKNGLSSTCFYCAGPHKSIECEHKTCEEKHSCSNCARSEDPAIKAQACSHNAASQKCPLLIAYRESMKERTEYWSGKK